MSERPIRWFVVSMSVSIESFAVDMQVAFDVIFFDLVPFGLEAEIEKDLLECTEIGGEQHVAVVPHGFVVVFVIASEKKYFDDIQSSRNLFV